jgi:hypothetical protein
MISRRGEVTATVIRVVYSLSQTDRLMNQPTAEQRKWAQEGLAYTIKCYDEWTREGFNDFTPMLDLLEHIRSSNEIELLSTWKSLDRLIIASAAHVLTQYNLIDGAPCLCVTQFEDEFIFSDACGRTRKCAFEDAANLFDVQLVRLRMKVDEFDAAKSRITK